jgi:hypothetical protein
MGNNLACQLIADHLARIRAVLRRQEAGRAASSSYRQTRRFDMSPQIAPAGRALTGGAVHQMTRRCALAAVCAGFVAISISTYGADPGTRYSTALAVPSQRAPAGGRPTPVYLINPPDAKPDRSMQRTRIVDPLYEELMRSSGCLLASKNASIGGGC